VVQVLPRLQQHLERRYLGFFTVQRAQPSQCQVQWYDRKPKCAFVRLSLLHENLEAVLCNQGSKEYSGTRQE